MTDQTHSSHARLTHGKRAQTRMIIPPQSNLFLHREPRVAASRAVSKYVEIRTSKKPWYKITPQKENPRHRLTHPRRKQSFARTPRATQCMDRAQTSTTVSGRLSSVDSLKRSCERCAYQEIRAKKYQILTNMQ